MHQYNQNKTIRTDQKFSVSMVLIATVTILTIGSTATTNVHAQVDCSANPDDPSCQGSSGSTGPQQPSPGSSLMCKIFVGGVLIMIGQPQLAPIGAQIVC
jgi:hypothetical protein